LNYPADKMELNREADLIAIAKINNEIEVNNIKINNINNNIGI